MRRTAPLFLATLLAACGWGVGAEGSTTTATATPNVVTTQATITTSPIGGGTAPDGITGTVDVVFDGDSMAVAVGSAIREVRLLGINAPEEGECFHDRSRDLVRTMATGEVTLVGDEYDQYDRLLAYVYVGETNLNEQVVRAGGAIATSADHPLRAEFIAAQQDATLRGAGLWAGDACGAEPATSTVSIRAIEADAPGRDDQDPNGEFVVLANSGDPVDMTGWVLRDESSVHRYRFPDGFTIGRDQSITVRSGCGQDGDDDLHWCAPGPVWNNDGDTAILLDAHGAFVSRLRYIDE